MEEELEPFADHEYKPQETDGRTTLQLHGEEGKLKKIEANKIPRIYEAMREGWGIDIQNAVIDGAIDIGAAELEQDEAGKCIIAGDADFRGARFTGNADFRGARFTGNADFERVRFYQHADFGGSRFTGSANFVDASFTGDADFRGARFTGDTNFERVRFYQHADFRGAGFTGSANFVDASFTGNADFFLARFYQHADFGGARFTGDADFGGARFAGNAYFNEASFARDAYFGGASFTGITSFVRARFTDGSFNEASFARDAYFGGARFECPADFAGLVVVRENTVWHGLWTYLFRPLLWPFAWLFTAGKLKLPPAIVTDICDMNTNTVIDTSSNPRLKRYIDDEQWIYSWRNNPKWRRLRSFGFWWWEVTSHCGRSIGLWAAWSFLIALAFGFLHREHIVVESVSNWYTPFYFSVVTFTTLGFGDVKPADWVGQLWITVEVVLGYVMLGGLISIFANKFARRS